MCSTWNPVTAPKHLASDGSRNPRTSTRSMPEPEPIRDYWRSFRGSLAPIFVATDEKLNMKSAEFGSPVEWHQDWAFYPHTNDDLLAVGIAIDAMTSENGCLLAIPGSHRGRVYNHHQDGHFAGAVTEADFNAEGAVPIEVGAGRCFDPPRSRAARLSTQHVKPTPPSAAVCVRRRGRLAPCAPGNGLGGIQCEDRRRKTHVRTPSYGCSRPGTLSTGTKGRLHLRDSNHP